MTQERNALALPEVESFKKEMIAINKFQQVVHATMVRDLDYGVIPGTQKPTLLKPGAEKIAKLLGLSDQYEIMDRAEQWQPPFFRYLIKCRLVHVATASVISEGLGECNSMESKYRYRWVGERDLPTDIDKTKLVSQERRSNKGGHWKVYRQDNEDIYSQVNTILKMAKKRALVDAALSAGRLSDVFTQDMEDMPDNALTETKELKVLPQPVIPGTTQPEGIEEEGDDNLPENQKAAPEVDATWLKETLGIIHWSTLDVVKWMNKQFDLADGGKTLRLTQRIDKLLPDQRLELVTHIQKLREAAGQ